MHEFLTVTLYRDMEILPVSEALGEDSSFRGVSKPELWRALLVGIAEVAF